jgi:hypothetical protein
MDRPVLAEVDRLHLELGIAQCETIRLKLQVLQGQLEQQTAQVNARLSAATREGFELQRQSPESWVYVPASAGVRGEHNGG